jgi:hypothetical protein
MCIHLRLIKISWRQTANQLRTTANVVMTHAVVYALVTTGICMYSCRNVWYAIVYGCRHIKYSSHAIWIPCSINILYTPIATPSSCPARCFTKQMGVICSMTKLLSELCALMRPVRVTWTLLATMVNTSTNGQTTRVPRIGGTTDSWAGLSSASCRCNLRCVRVCGKFVPAVFCG